MAAEERTENESHSLGADLCSVQCSNVKAVMYQAVRSQADVQYCSAVLGSTEYVREKE